MAGDEKTIRLVVIDFDQTMTNCHTHNAAFNGRVFSYTSRKGLILNGKACQGTKVSKNYSEKALKDWAEGYFDAEERFVGKEEQVRFFRDLLEKEVKITIASHTHYPLIIELALRVMGFTDDEISKIDIICGSPLIELAGKNEHIALAMGRHSIESFEEVLLIDDSEYNINRACTKKAKIVYVENPGDYIENAMEFFVDDSSEDVAGSAVFNWSEGSDDEACLVGEAQC